MSPARFAIRLWKRLPRPARVRLHREVRRIATLSLSLRRPRPPPRPCLRGPTAS